MEKEYIQLNLHDEEYPNDGYTHTRNVARAFVYDENNNFAICHLYGDDIFGHRDYYETPGGGVDENETFEDAVIRELDEEIGYKCVIEEYLGEVKDEYNLIHRKNINRYFLCRVVEKTRIHHESDGDNIIESINWFPIEKIEELYRDMPDFGVSKLVKQREYCFITKLVCKFEKK